MKILFLGPCRKQNRQTGETHRPFDPKTLSGSYVALIQKALLGLSCEFCFSNVIDGLHFDGDSEEKNPEAADLVAGWAQFERRLKKMKVDYIIAFGSNVRSAFERVDNLEYSSGHVHQRGLLKVIFAPHPSFVMIYRRKKMHDYIIALSRLISSDAELVQDFSGA